MPRRNGHGIDLLADPTRRAIASLLALGQDRPSKIADELGLSRQAVSRQLSILQKAGLILRRRHYMDGRGWMYYFDPRKLGQITAWLAGTEVGRVFATNRDRETWISRLVPFERNEADSSAQGDKMPGGGEKIPAANERAGQSKPG